MNRYPDYHNNLNPREQNALKVFINSINQDYRDTVQQVWLYGSCVRGSRSKYSDIDLFLISSTDDWRAHEPIRFLAARVSNELDVFLSVKIVGLNHLQRLRSIQPGYYQLIINEGIKILDSQTDLLFHKTPT